MDLYNQSISAAYAASSDSDSAASQGALADERRADRAHAFKVAMERTIAATNQFIAADVAGPLAATPPRVAARLLADPALSPALLKLEADGHPITDTPVDQPTADVFTEPAPHGHAVDVIVALSDDRPTPVLNRPAGNSTIIGGSIS